jgi:hypothetical protein
METWRAEEKRALANQNWKKDSGFLFNFGMIVLDKFQKKNQNLSNIGADEDLGCELVAQFQRSLYNHRW